MGLSVQLDRQADKALYQQIVQQIKSRINRGLLSPGTKLPTVRQLAADLGVTRLTVHNAYSELQAEGWIEATVGRGTFVSTSVRPQELLADIGQQLTADDAVRNMTSISQMTGLYSLAYAFPDAGLLPLGPFWEEFVLLRDELPALMQYGSAAGDPLLHSELEPLLKKRGVHVSPEEIVVCGGATQGLALITQALTQPGETVIVEQPTYHGFLSILEANRVQPVGVPLTETGPQFDVLERLIVQHRPRFFYTVPNFHNPTGYCMSPECRRELLALAARYELLLVEDDTYGLISYLPEPPPALKKEDRQESVIYVGGLSKVLLPGLRIGYVIAPPWLRQQLLNRRIAFDLFGPLLLQRALAHFLKKRKLAAHLREVLPVYKARRDALLQALQRWLPKEARWTKPEGGFSCWVTLPSDSRLDDLYQAALNQGVAYTPGTAFTIETPSQPCFRLCFGSQPIDVIQESVMVLGTLAQERLAEPRAEADLSLNWIPPV